MANVIMRLEWVWHCVCSVWHPLLPSWEDALGILALSPMHVFIQVHLTVWIMMTAGFLQTVWIKPIEQPLSAM